MLDRPDFFTWLTKTHPDVMLTLDQVSWVNAHEHGKAMWTAGRRSGRTFVTDLYAEYLRSIA